MVLISAHIQNFGKFHDADFEFNAGLNSFLHENGWGKTTLSVFIKSMLYGLETTTSHDLEKNEKQKYFPWQGGIFGGSLVFEHSGKNYKVTRTFGKKKNDDTFELIDLKTNKRSPDFSERLGEEIYGIGRETYERSAHIALSESPAGSPEISAKLANLIEADDVGNFDRAYAALDKKATSLKTKRRNSGKIPMLQAQIEADREKLSDIQSRIFQNEELSKLIEETEKKAELQKQQQSTITNQLSISTRYAEKKLADAEIANLESEKRNLETEIKVLKMQKIPNVKRIVFFSLTGVATVTGILGFFVLKNFWLGTAILGVGLGFSIAGILCRAKKMECPEQEAHLAELENKIECAKEKRDSTYKNLEKPEKTVDELNSELAIASEKFNSLVRDSANYKKMFNDNLTFTEKKEDTESEIDSLSAEKKEKEEEYEILMKTLDFLSRAKENLDANYSDPMKEGFEKYIELLTKSGGPKLAIDTDLKVSVDSESGRYESEFLSEGYKDLVNFCSRMALIDALFKEEKPPVILDDPFVNLDDDKVPASLALVKKMSEEKQILYFCCHKSREPKI